MLPTIFFLLILHFEKKISVFFKGYSQFNEVCTVSEAMAAAALSVDSL